MIVDRQLTRLILKEKSVGRLIYFIQSLLEEEGLRNYSYCKKKRRQICSTFPVQGYNDSQKRILKY